MAVPNAERQLLIDDDVYRHIKEAGDIGESASSILRRLLRINVAPRLATPESAPDGAAQRNSDENPILGHLESDAFRFVRNATDRYLSILAVAYKADPAGFKNVLTLTGSSRQYFAKSEAEINNSGVNTAPRQIPNSSYWALTNADTKTKIEMLGRVLRRLGYPEHTVTLACSRLR